PPEPPEPRRSTCDSFPPLRCFPGSPRKIRAQAQLEAGSGTAVDAASAVCVSRWVRELELHFGFHREERSGNEMEAGLLVGPDRRPVAGFDGQPQSAVAARTSCLDHGTVQF